MVLAPCAQCGTTNRIPEARLRDGPVCGECRHALLPGETVPATDRTFAVEVEASPVPVLVDFWAPWCAPCRMVAPILDDLAARHRGRLKVVKVNVDESPEVASRFAVSSIPALKIFKNGTVVDEAVGALPRQSLESLVAIHL